jgi:hypothetical protein
MYDFINQESIKSGALHHAYIFEGDIKKTTDKIIASFVNAGIQTESNPDFTKEEYLKFSIDDAKEFKRKNSEKSMTDNGKRFVILGMHATTREAEVPLLKLLEEPVIGTHFIIVVPRAHIFSPTVLSRAIIVKNNDEDRKSKKEYKNFVYTSYPERLEMIKEMIGSFDKEDNTVMLKKEAEELLADVEVNLSKNLKDNLEDKNIQEALEYIIELRGYMFDDGFALKNSLEALALIVPVLNK